MSKRTGRATNLGATREEPYDLAVDLAERSRRSEQELSHEELEALRALGDLD